MGIVSHALTDVVGQGTQWDGRDIGNDNIVKDGDIVIMEQLEGDLAGGMVDASYLSDASHAAIVERGSDGKL